MRRFLRRLLVWALGLVVLVGIVAAAAIAAASLIFLRLRRIDGVPMPQALWCWIDYWQPYSADPRVRGDLLVAIAVPAAIVALLLLVVLMAASSSRQRLRRARPGQKVPAPVRAASDTHGSAEWMSIREARKLFPGPHPAYGGVVIGEAYRVDQDSVAELRFDPAEPQTWGRGGRAPLLVDPCTGDSTHGLVFAGSGGFKTTAIAIPTLTTWTGSAVVLDPSCQLGPMSVAMREAMGHTVAQVGPGLDGFNPLDWIDITNPLAETHVQAVIDWITGDEASGSISSDDKNEMFKVRAKELMTCILADMLWSDQPPERKTLREFRTRLCTPEKKMKGMFQDIAVNSKSPLARALANTLADIFIETFSGIYSNAMSNTQWLSITPYGNMLSGSSFKTMDLRGGNLTVFIQIPMDSLRTAPALARVVVGALANAIYQAEGKISGRALLLLDEVRFLGRLKALEDVRDAGRKYGMTLIAMWQSVGQLEGTWGKEGKSSWFNSASWRLYAALDDQATCEDVSKTCGSYTILKRTEGQSSGSNSGNSSGSSSKGRNEGLAEAGRELIRPDEIRRKMRQDEQILFRRGAKPLRCGRAIYFRRPEMLAKVEADRFRAAAE